jgi:hypothetical protein
MQRHRAGKLQLYAAGLDATDGVTPLESNVFHVAATFETRGSASSVIKIYVNGRPDNSGDPSNHPASPLSNYGPGADGLGLGGAYSGQFVMSGTLDEVAVYDHALDAATIAAHYAAGAP